MHPGLIFVLSALLAYALTPLASRVANGLGAVDLPGNRKVHLLPIPRLGGLAVGMAVILMALVSLGKIWLLPPWPGIWLGAFAMGVLGFADDLGNLGPWPKLAVQAVAALAAVAGGLLLPLGEFSIPGTLLFITFATNAVNLIDGLDGLAGGIGFLAALALAGFASGDMHVVVLTSALAGALTGFLRYNFHPARIFLGDTGSLFLGFLLACIAVRAVRGGQGAAALVVLAVPLLDAFSAISRRYWLAYASGGLRAMRLGTAFVPDRSHIHHRLLDLGLSQRKAVAVLYGLAAASVWAAVVAGPWAPAGAVLLFMGVRLLIAAANNRGGT